MNHNDLQTLWELAVGYWWVFVLFVFPAIGAGFEELARWNRRRIKARRKHQLAMARARARTEAHTWDDWDDRQAIPPPAADPGLAEAIADLRLRFGRGEISREEYLQGKVELEDL